jgi:hypothetical protein
MPEDKKGGNNIMSEKLAFWFLFISINTFISCSSMQASIQANQRLNKAPEDVVRGDPINNVLVKEYLQNVLLSSEGREVKVYTRRAFSPNNKKNSIVFHMFYAYFKDGIMEHTLVFTATPEESEFDGSWMLDSYTDVESYILYTESSNPWEVEEYRGPKGEAVLDLIGTTNKILERLEKGYTFFGPASIRNIPWYHIVWLTIVPPPFSPQVLMLLSMHKDNCTSAVLETIVWE